VEDVEFFWQQQFCLGGGLCRAMARRLLSFVEALTQPPTPLKLMQSSTFGDALGIAWVPIVLPPMQN